MSRPKSAGVEEPYAAWPETQIAPTERAVRLSGTYKSPSGWWQHGFHGVLWVAGFALAPASCVFTRDVIYGGNPRALTWDVGLISLLVWIGLLVLIGMIAEYYGTRRRLHVNMDDDTIEINGKAYSRAVPHQFALEEHERAFAESRLANQSRVYRDAQQVVMRYGERRVVVADFHRLNVREAEALHRRLQIFDSEWDKVMGLAASGAAVEPDEFGKEPPLR